MYALVTKPCPLIREALEVAGPDPANKVIAMMGDSAPDVPQDLSLFSTRVDGFGLAVIRDCRTMERLDRRIGQTQGCDPSAESSLEWMAAFGPPPGTARRTI